MLKLVFPELLLPFVVLLLRVVNLSVPPPLPDHLVTNPHREDAVVS